MSNGKRITSKKKTQMLFPLFDPSKPYGTGTDSERGEWFTQNLLPYDCSPPHLIRLDLLGGSTTDEEQKEGL